MDNHDYSLKVLQLIEQSIAGVPYEQAAKDIFGIDVEPLPPEMDYDDIMRGAKEADDES